MPDNRRISGETPQGDSKDSSDYILAHGVQLKEDYIVKQGKILRKALILPDGIEYLEGYVLPAGMILP